MCYVECEPLWMKLAIIPNGFRSTQLSSIHSPHTWHERPCNHDRQMRTARLNQSASYPNAGFRLTCHSPLCLYAAWSSLPVSELQLSAATPLWLFTERQSLPSWIEFNCMRSAAVGKVATLSIYWLDAACRLVIPLRQVTLAQLN